MVGNAMQTSADGAYIARHVALRAGCAIETPALTVNRLCGSGFEAIVQGAQQILLGESRVVLAAGSESMSQAPHVVRGIRWGTKLGASPALEDLLWQGLTDSLCGCPMGITAENLAKNTGSRAPRWMPTRCGPSRRQRPRGTAGGLPTSSCPVPITNRKTKQAEPWAADEHMRPETTAEGLAKLAAGLYEGRGGHRRERFRHLPTAPPPASSPRRISPEERGLTPLGPAGLVGRGGRGARDHGHRSRPRGATGAPRAGMRLDQMDRVEVNEAFAAQYLAVEKELGLDRDKTNVEGGAVAIGHPLGASGTRITVHLLHTLRRIGKRFGLGSACIGGGQGIAVIVEAY